MNIKASTRSVQAQFEPNSKKNGLNLIKRNTPVKARILFCINTIFDSTFFVLDSKVIYTNACINFITITKINTEQKNTNKGVFIKEFILAAMLFMFA